MPTHDKADFLLSPAATPGIEQRLRAASGGQGDDELSCSAFGFLRGLHERSLALELRLKTGDREAYPYSMLAAVRFNPSVGVLLKFTGDLTTLVLIGGSNLDLRVHSGTADLVEGLERQRVLWVREMDPHELRAAGDREPTVDRIEIAEFEAHAALTDWLKATAPAFVRE
jgi:hypothetical protein